MPGSTFFRLSAEGDGGVGIGGRGVGGVGVGFLGARRFGSRTIVLRNNFGRDPAIYGIQSPKTIRIQNRFFQPLSLSNISKESVFPSFLSRGNMFFRNISSAMYPLYFMQSVTGVKILKDDQTFFTVLGAVELTRASGSIFKGLNKIVQTAVLGKGSALKVAASRAGIVGFGILAASAIGDLVHEKIMTKATKQEEGRIKQRTGFIADRIFNMTVENKNRDWQQRFANDFRAQFNFGYSLN